MTEPPGTGAGAGPRVGPLEERGDPPTLTHEAVPPPWALHLHRVPSKQHRTSSPLDGAHHVPPASRGTPERLTSDGHATIWRSGHPDRTPWTPSCEAPAYPRPQPLPGRGKGSDGCRD